MSKHTHTPGPWHKGSDAGNGRGSIFGNDGRVRLEDGGTTLYPVAQIGTGWDEGEDAANGQLIVSAPDLLGTLQDALAWSTFDANNEDGYPSQEMMDNRVEALTAAIAKATKIPTDNS